MQVDGSAACRGATRMSGARAQHVIMAQRFVCRPLNVRKTLGILMKRLAPWKLSQEAAAATELVVAEVLNNVAEHAYGDCPGPVDIWVGKVPAGLSVVIIDRGAPMPEGTPPLGRPLMQDVPLDQLPEGGFGWYLIRSLTQQLDYRREAGHNRLSFLVPLTSAVAHD